MGGSLLLLACGGGGPGARPVASLASSGEAEIAYAPIRDAWAVATKPAARAKLVGALDAFLVRFPSDGLAPLARAQLAVAELDAGDMAGAEAELARLESVPPGATRDLVDVAHARDLRLRKYPDIAFDRLHPLVGKVVDPTTRLLLQEEVSLAAIEAHRDYEAIAYMDAWLRESGEDAREGVRATVASALATEPEAVLVNALRAMRSGGAASGYGREIQRLVTDRLGAIALARGDSDLARWLVAGDTPGVILGSHEGELGELATTHRGLSSVDGRTIGLVLPTGSSDLRDEAAAIARGAAWALELPRTDASAGDGTKLVTRDDGGDVERVAPAMSELAGEGASVILAALEPRAADRAVRWGEEHGVAVITLAAPSSVAPRAWAFVVGVPRDAEIAALAEDLVSRGVTSIVPIVPPSSDDGVPALARGSVQLEPSFACDTAAAQSGEARFPIDDWKRERVHAWLVDAPSECARDLVRSLRDAGLGGRVALTLDASSTSERAPLLHLTAVSAGSIPLVSPGPSTPADLKSFALHEGAPPNAWVALGHDAALLARRAVAALPVDRVSDANKVKALRAQARDALAVAKGSLWTTRADGFAATHSLPRDLGVVDLDPGPRHGGGASSSTPRE